MFTIKKNNFFLFLTLCSFLLGMVLINPVKASTSPQVPSANASKQFVKELIDEGMKIANNPNAGENEFGGLLSSKAVIRAIAHFVLGSHVRQMSPNQLEKFIELYQKRLIKIYSTPEKLRTFRGTTHTIDQNAAEQPDGTMLVKTYFHFNDSPNSEPAKVYWKVVMKDGKLYVFDILFEGISKLLTERQDYHAIFVAQDKGKNDPDHFLKYLSEQIG